MDSDELLRSPSSAQNDQVDAAIKSMARVLTRFRNELLASGFTPNETFELVCIYQEFLLKSVQV